MLSRRALPFALAGAALAMRVSEANALPARELFTLGRSKNKNVVRYAVRTTRDGHLDRAEPVEAYWLMLAEDGRREPLTWTEQKLAYGFSVTRLASDTLTLHLSACPSRELHVRATEAGFRAELSIARQAAFLRRIFVRTEEGLLMPRVLYIEITGTNAAGQTVSERLTP